MSHLERELETERDRIKKQLNREEELRSRLLLTENSLTGKQQDVHRLEKMLDVVKQECSSQLQDRVSLHIFCSVKLKTAWSSVNTELIAL